MSSNTRRATWIALGGIVAAAFALSGWVWLGGLPGGPAGTLNAWVTAWPLWALHSNADPIATAYGSAPLTVNYLPALSPPTSLLYHLLRAVSEPLTAYHWLLPLFLTLNGVTAYAWARRWPWLQAQPGVTLAVALLLGLNPLAFWLAEAGNWSALGVYALFWTLERADAYTVRPHPVRALWLGVACLLALWQNLAYLDGLLLVTLPYLVYRLRQAAIPQNGRYLPLSALVVALGAAIFPLGPLMWTHYHEILPAYVAWSGPAWPEALAALASLTPVYLLENLLGVPDPVNRALFPLIAWCALTLGLVAWGRRVPPVLLVALAGGMLALWWGVPLLRDSPPGGVVPREDVALNALPGRFTVLDWPACLAALEAPFAQDCAPTQVQADALRHAQPTVGGWVPRRPDLNFLVQEPLLRLAFDLPLYYDDATAFAADLRQSARRAQVGAVRLAADDADELARFSAWAALSGTFCEINRDARRVLYQADWLAEGCSYGVDVGTPADEFVMGAGWHGRESWNDGTTLRWQRDAEATLRFYVHPAGDYELVLRLASPLSAAQTLAVQLNGEPFTTLTLDAALQEVVIPLPEDRLPPDGLLRWTLQAGEVRQVEGRSLALALDAIVVRRPASPG